MRLLSLSLCLLFLMGGLVSCQAPEPPSEALLANRTVVDLTYSFNEETVYWPTAPQEFELETDFEGETEAGYYYSAYTFCAAEHGGTHLDAPKHFAEGRPAVDEMPVEQFIGPAVVVDVSEQTLDDPDYRVTAEDFRTWEDEHGRIPDEAILIVRTGYGQYYPDREEYMGTTERGEEALEDLHFPGLHPDAAQWLVENRSISAFGIDTPSLDYGQSVEFRAHQNLFQEDIVGLENLANLDQLPATGFEVIALPMKIEGGSGAPVRVVALLPESS